MRRVTESFDLLTAAQLGQTRKLDYVGSGVVTVTGQTGNGLTGTGGGVSAANTIRTRAANPGTADTGYHGFAVKFLSLPATEQKLWALLSNVGSVQAVVTVTPSGTARVYRGTFESGTLLGTSSLTFVSSVFRYLEMGHVLSGAGRFEVRSTDASGAARVHVVNGATSGAAWSNVEIYLTDQIVIDNLYANDASIALAPSYFSGPQEIVALSPVSVAFEDAIFTVPWLPNTGSDKAAVIADDPLDGDASYLFTRARFSYITFAMETLDESDERRIDDVQIVGLARVVSSAFQPDWTFYIRRDDGVGLFSYSRTPSGPVTQTDYTAFRDSLAGHLGGPRWTAERLNASTFGVMS